MSLNDLVDEDKFPFQEDEQLLRLLRARRARLELTLDNHPWNPELSLALDLVTTLEGQVLEGKP